jgi:hypothetical protein
LLPVLFYSRNQAENKERTPIVAMELVGRIASPGGSLPGIACRVRLLESTGQPQIQSSNLPKTLDISALSAERRRKKRMDCSWI